MNHLFVTQDYAPDLGGMARRHVELCRRAGTDAMVVSTVASADSGAFERGESYRIHRQPFAFAAAKRFVNQIRWARSIAEECRGAAGAQVIHCGNIRPCGYGVWMASRRVHRPYVLYVYGGDVLREIEKTRGSALKRRTARGIFAGAAGIVAISTWTVERTRELLAQVGVTGPPPISEIPLGTEPEQFHPRNDLGRLRRRLGIGAAPLLLTVARLVPHKGQDVAIRAVAALATEFPDLRYLVVGEGHDADRLRALARSLGVGERVILSGSLPDDEVAEAYATSTVYVGLSRIEQRVTAEGFGLAFVEAGASGVPSVAGDSGGVRSAVRHGETGLVVPPLDVDAVVSTLRGMLHHRENRMAMGAAARRAVETFYNWDRVARETFSFVRDVTLSWR